MNDSAVNDVGHDRRPVAPPTTGLPRLFEAVVALAGLLVAAPIMIVAAVLVRLTSPGPIFFRQQRVGRQGHRFEMRKFRTMLVDGVGPSVTAHGDDRVTAVGRILRKTKLDELPELWHVVRGEMSLVGHRPEVPRYVDPDDRLWREVLLSRPGLTDPNALDLRNEEELLARIEGNREEYYLRVLQPYKLLVSVAYLRSRNWRTDLGILARTALAVMIPSRSAPPALEDIELRVAAFRAGGAEGAFND